MGDTTYALKPDAMDSDAAFKPAAARVPTPKAQVHTVKIDPNKVDAGYLVAPEGMPDVSNVDASTAVEILKSAIEEIYGRMEKRIPAVQQTLAKVVAPRTPLAYSLLSALVEVAATAVGAEIGLRAAAHLKAALGEVAGAAIGEALKNNAKKVGAAAGGAVDAALNASKPTERTDVSDSAPGRSLLEDFLEKEATALSGRKVQAVATALTLKPALAHMDADHMAQLITATASLPGDDHLYAWFERHLAMEWINFCARLSLGPRTEGQLTEMPGANKVDGLAGKGGGFAAWQGGVGFVDIEIDSPAVVRSTIGLSLGSATIAGSPGAAAALRSAASDIAPDGKPYSLATLPVYRRIWFVRGKHTKFDRPELVITPDGRIEVDANSPTLVAIATGRPIEFDPLHLDVPVGSDPTKLAEAEGNARDAMIGGEVIAFWLSMYKPDELR